MGCGSSKGQVKDKSGKDNKTAPKSKTGKTDDKSKKDKKNEHPAKSYNYSDFPTPDMLADAQRKYKGDKGKKKTTKEADGIPAPFPPPTTKAEVFNPKDYALIDQRAQMAPLELASKSYEALVSYLIKPAKNEIGKARAIFVWIASQRLQKVLDYIGDKVPANDKPLYTILHILVKQWGNGYSEMFSKMCSQARIPCKIIKGRVKGNGYRIGEKTAGTNDYCIIYVDGCWRIVDQHWGSQFIVGGVQNDDWETLHNPDNKEHTGALQSGTLLSDDTGHICDDFYFLTDPEAIVFTHLACEQQHQLLARPVTEEEFWQMALLKDAFFDLEMTTVSHPKCLVESDNDGKIVFEFGLSRNRQSLYCYTLSKSIYDQAANRVNGVNIEQYVLMEKLPDKLKVTIHFPKIGRYKFDLYGKDKINKEGYEVVCEYAIVCHKPDLKFEPLPENTRSEWGPGTDTENLGLVPVSTEGGIIEAKEGKAHIRFKMNDSKDLLFHTKLKSVEHPKEDLKDCVRHYRTDQEAAFLMKLPQQGRYILEVSAKDPKKDKTYKSICNYLIKSDQGCYDLAPYPECDNKTCQTGDMASTGEDIKLIPQNYKEAIIDPLQSNKAELNIKMVTNKPDAEFRTQMKKFYHLDNEVEDQSQYVYFQQTKQNLDFLLNFPEVGFYKFDVLSKNKIVYQYLINVQKPNVKCVPYPIRSQTWQGYYEVIEPKTGHLQANQKVHFKVRINKAKLVKVEGKTVSKDLVTKKDGLDIWEGDLVTPKEGGTLKIKADLVGDAAEEPLTMLTYTVLSSEDVHEIVAKQEEADKKASEHLKEIDEQKEAEEKIQVQKKKEDEAKLREAQEDFKRNKDKYEKEEEILRKKELEEEKKIQMTEESAQDGQTMEEDKLDSSELIEIVQETKKKPAKKPKQEPLKRHEELEEEDEIPPLPLSSNYDYEESYDPGKTTRRHKVDGNEDWKKYHPKLTNNIALERLRECVCRRDRTMLKSSIDDCCENGLENHKEVKTASVTLSTLEARKRLQAACASKDPAAIRQELDDIRDSGLTKYLQNETREANYVLESLERPSHLKKTCMNMDKKTMTEIRRYQNPPPMFQKVMQATLLLLGEDEDSTENWKDCQRLCNPQGVNGFNRKVLLLDPAKVNPEIVARSDEILQDCDINKVRTVGPGAGTFYVWSKGVIDECKTMQDYSKVKPANRERQKEILGKVQQADQVKNRNYYKTLATNGTTPTQKLSPAPTRDSRYNSDAGNRY